MNLENLIAAEKKAAELFNLIEKRALITAGKTERELNKEIYELAFELYGIKKYWHKRIVRAGENTLLPYKENPPDKVLQTDDILFFDFGPVFEEWEADFGRTYVIGNDPEKIRLMNDVSLAWTEARNYYLQQSKISGAEFYDYLKQLAENYNWEFGGPIGGHLIGNFPHEKIFGEELINYIHPENNTDMKATYKGLERNWILEIHFVNKKKKIGGFFEQLLY